MRADGYHREVRDEQCLLLLVIGGEERIISRSALPTDRSWAPTNQTVADAEAMQREVGPRPAPAPMLPTRIGNVDLATNDGLARLLAGATPQLAARIVFGVAHPAAIAHFIRANAMNSAA